MHGCSTRAYGCQNIHITSFVVHVDARDMTVVLVQMVVGARLDAGVSGILRVYRYQPFRPFQCSENMRAARQMAIRRLRPKSGQPWA